MRVEDWRNLDAGALTHFYEAERRRWRERLAWDAEPSLRILEEARAAGQLPGFVLRDREARLAGWAYYVVRDRVLQIGGILGPTAEAVRSLLDAVLRSTEADTAAELSCFAFPDSAALESALVRRRFTVQRYEYLQRDLAPDPWPGPDGTHAAEFGLRSWQDADALPVVRLLARAYAGSPSARCFAPHARMDQWAHYVSQLLHTPSCGEFDAPASFVIERRGDGQMAGALIATRIGPETGHVAQLAVDPACRHHGLATRLVVATMDAMRAAGCRRVTLCVHEENQSARRLYETLEFAAIERFVHGHRLALRRDHLTRPTADAASDESVPDLAP